jgi:hypothetical protein
MAPLAIFRTNFGHLVDCYLDGGYSDDTIVSCIAQENGFVCAHPPRAIFPNVVDPRTPMRRYWEFVKRQFFVTDTYSTPYNRSVVHSLAWLIVSSIYLCVIWLTVTPFIGVIVMLAWSTTDKPFVWTLTARFSVACVPLGVLMLWTVKFFTYSMARVSNSLRPPEQQVECSVSLFKIMIGMAVHVYLMPIAVIVIMLSDYIVWAGVRYYKKKGKIWKVERMDETGLYRSELASISIAKALRDPKLKQMIQGHGLEPVAT